MKKLGLLKLIFLYFLIPILIGLCCYEIYYRVNMSNKVNTHYKNAYFWIQNKTLYDSRDEKGPDWIFGYNVKTDSNALFRTNDVLDVSVVPISLLGNSVNFSVKTNNLGLMSDNNYELDRTLYEPEYRIVVLGDSMTGPTTSTYQWVDTIQELLNKSSKFKAGVGGKKIKVYNLGWVAAGFDSFANAFELIGVKLDPDLVIINYIEIDFPRTAKGAPYYGQHILEENKMVKHASDSIDRILKHNKNIILTLMPIYNELVSSDINDTPRTNMLKSLRDDLKIINMRYMMPRSASNEEIYDWFNLPQDAHYSDRGGEIYARSLAGVIFEHVIGEHDNFFDLETKYSSEVLGPSSSRTRKISNSTSRFIDKPEQLAYVRDFVLQKLIKARVFRKELWVLDRLKKTGVDGVSIPYSQKFTTGWEEIQYMDGDDNKVYLNLSCSTLPYTLENPDCYTHFHFYINDLRG